MSLLEKDFRSANSASTSKEVLEQDGARSSSSKMLKVTLLADELGSSKGGVSTINRELAKQLAKHPNVQVTLFVPKCSDEDRKTVGDLGIKVLEAKERPGFKPIDWLTFPPSDLSIDVIVGHGVKLGRQAQIIKETHYCKWVHVVHIAPEELEMCKGSSGAIPKGTEKHQAEIKLCQIADFVVAVGPKLAQDFSASLRSCKKEVFDLTPSIFSEFTHLAVEQSPRIGQIFRVLVLGHGDPEDFQLKGHDIAAKAVAQLKDPNCHLIFVGAPSGKEDEIKKNLLKHGIDQSQLIIRILCESQEGLASLFCEADLLIMPSRTEGFGLTALQAFSAGLPVLVCHNSGFGQALGQVPFGSSCIVGSEDANVWAEKIKRVQQKDWKIQQEESQELRTRYAKTFNWQKQCEAFVQPLMSMIHEEVVSKSSTEIQASERLKLGTVTHRDRVKVRNDCVTIAAPSPQSADTVHHAESYQPFPTADQNINLFPSRYRPLDAFNWHMQEMRKLVTENTEKGSLANKEVIEVTSSNWDWPEL